MISWLIHHFVKEKKSSPQARYKVSRLLESVGIVLNTFLFASKYLIGLLVGSVAIKADAVNNLTDSISNIVSILSFHFAEKPADKEHPFGHERTETIAALFMGMLIVYLGIEMLRQSVEKILHPQPFHFEWAAPGVLLLSIAVKFYMYAYNRKYGHKYHSELLIANSLDSRNDMAGTALILVSTLISPLIHYDLDGIMGVVTAILIFYSAWGLLHDVISTLLGEAPSQDQINELVDLLMDSPIVIDVHDVVIHSYGPRYQYATAHVEVDSSLSLMEAHEEIDRIERMISQKMGIEMVTHVDPVQLHDQETIQAADRLYAAISRVSPSWSVQDLRVEPEAGSSKKKLYFDLIVPYEEQRCCADLEKQIREKMHGQDEYDMIMRIVHPYS